MEGLVALGKRYACFLERHWQMGRKLRQGDRVQVAIYRRNLNSQKLRL